MQSAMLAAGCASILPAPSEKCICELLPGEVPVAQPSKWLNLLMMHLMANWSPLWLTSLSTADRTALQFMVLHDDMNTKTVGYYLIESSECMKAWYLQARWNSRLVSSLIKCGQLTVWWANWPYDKLSAELTIWWLTHLTTWLAPISSKFLQSNIQSSH